MAKICDMEGNKCTCQLCGNDAIFKELDTPEQRKYSCPVCNEYVMAFQLNNYPNLRDQVLRYQPEIAKCLQEIRKGCKECVEIVLHEGLAKDRNQISLRQLIDEACNMRKHE